jgi:NTE family protein
LAADTIGEDAFVARSVYSTLAGRAWPPAFRAAAVSTTTGRLMVWSKDSHVDLAKAVASSSSVPGVCPPVTLSGDRYMDGGVRSSLNADLAAGARSVIVVSCFSLTPPDGIDAHLRHLYDDLARELDTITAAGGSLDVIEPGPGRAVPDEILAHISPAHSENINFFGVIIVDVEAELAKLDPAGWRPLRPAAPDLSTLL